MIPPSFLRHRSIAHARCQWEDRERRSLSSREPAWAATRLAEAQSWQMSFGPELFTVDIDPARIDMRNSGRTISVNNALTRYAVIRAANHVVGGDDPIDGRVQLDTHRLPDIEFLDRLGAGGDEIANANQRAATERTSFLSIAAPTFSDRCRPGLAFARRHECISADLTTPPIPVEETQ